MEQFKDTIDMLKRFVEQSCGKAKVEMQTEDGYIVTISVKKDDGTMDLDEEEITDDYCVEDENERFTGSIDYNDD